MPPASSPASAPFAAILFDVGGVMLTNGWDHVERAVVLRQFGLDKEAFEALHPDPYDAWERDVTTVDDYLKATVFYEPRNFTPQDFIAAMKLQSVPIPDNALGILAEVSASDKVSDTLIGLLNNESRLLHEYRMEKYGLNQYLDVQLSSCYLGLRKPEPAIYRRAIDILGVPASRILFIDDRKGNCDAAAAEGIHAIQFLGAAKLHTDFEQLGIL